MNTESVPLLTELGTDPVFVQFARNGWLTHPEGTGDMLLTGETLGGFEQYLALDRFQNMHHTHLDRPAARDRTAPPITSIDNRSGQIGRASCRERVSSPV